MTDSISVVTVTRSRPGLLTRAIDSVRRQQYPGRIEHVVLVDDDPATVRSLADQQPSPERPLVVQLVDSPPELIAPRSSRAFIYPRLAELLNLGVRLATSPWIAFLDDDNEYEPDHLHGLREFAASTSCRAVHSARTVFWADGRPYLAPLFPGAPTPSEGARLYDLMCSRGVWERGTNILRDRVDLDGRSFSNSTVMADGDPIFLVDQNVWLISRELLLEIPVPEVFSEQEIEANTCPDDKMLESFVRSGVEIRGSGIPSVRYYLGGVSNGDEQPREGRG